MKNELFPEITISEMKKELTNQTIENIWKNYIDWIKTFKPLCIKLIEYFSKEINYSQTKKEKHITVIQNAFEYINSWKLEKHKIVKTRKNEIDSAISFVRNKAIIKKFSKSLISPLSRNLAGLLRTCLHISVNNYKNEQIPFLTARAIFDIAACRSFFPVDINNLIQFLPKGKSLIDTTQNDNCDNYHLMLEISAGKLGLKNELTSLNSEAVNIWNSFDKPKQMNIPDDLFSIQTNGLSNRLYYLGLKNFYNK
jgi:hypothetical protein